MANSFACAGEDFAVPLPCSGMRTLRSLFIHRYGLAAVAAGAALGVGALALGDAGVTLACGGLAVASFALWERERRRRSVHDIAGGEMLSAIPGAAVLVGVDGVIQAANDGWAEAFSEPRSALVGTSLTAPFVPRVAHSPLSMLVRRALAHGDAADDVPLTGSTPWHITAHRLADAQGRAVVLRAHDTDEHARLVRRLERSDATSDSLRRLIDALGSSSIEHMRERTAAASTTGSRAAMVIGRADATRMVVLAAAGTRLRRGQSLPLAGDDLIAEVVVEGGERHVVRGGLHGAAPEAIDRMLRGWNEAMLAPIWREDELVGALVVAAADPFSVDDLGWVRTCARLLSAAEASADHRELRARISGRDPLTGVLNHRAFMEAAADALSAARAEGAPLALCVFNIDHFRQINTLHGHDAGDGALVEIARRLQGEAARGEIIGRIGGEEFAVVMPAVDAAGAEGAAEWLRSVISHAPIDAVGVVTASVGIADSTQLEHDADIGSLLRLAAGAVFWAKAHGRDQAVRYDPKVVRELTPTERAERIERAHALSALRALARVVDAKDAMTHRHAERVAQMAYRLAIALDWSPQSAARLRDAALVHDVGKVAVPDAILHKAGPLDDAEMEQVREHAHIGSMIVAEVLSDDQVDWVRGHHERWDGRGYPDGRATRDIPDGAALIALADAWDVMTQPRPYRPEPLTPEGALAECRAGVGRQFAPFAVKALERLWDEGLIGPDRSTPRPPLRIGPVDVHSPA